MNYKDMKKIEKMADKSHAGFIKVLQHSKVNGQ